MEYNKGSRLPEINITAELYHRLRNNNIKCVLSHSMLTKDGYRCTPDLIVLKEMSEGVFDIAIIIEVKNRPFVSANKHNTTQHERYTLFGVPLLYCINRAYIDNTVKSVLQILNR